MKQGYVLRPPLFNFAGAHILAYAAGLKLWEIREILKRKHTL
jgi:hypothetical protein